jgi:hypothetical protein
LTGGSGGVGLALNGVACGSVLSRERLHGPATYRPARGRSSGSRA